MADESNSRLTRVQPVFKWLKEQDDEFWPARLVSLAHGVEKLANCGPIERVHLDLELEVSATPARLIWMLENASRLVPSNGRNWGQLSKRVADQAKVREAIEALKAGKAPAREFVLEGRTHADCLIECEHALIWIEGKRFDWLSPSTTWDVNRDQLARNVEAAWTLAQKAGKEYRLLICHEFPLKHHEVALLGGYRAGTWSAGLPHISPQDRQQFRERIGTLTWNEIARAWSTMPALHRVGARDHV